MTRPQEALGEERLQAMLNICRYHRQHERYHTTESMNIAVELRRHSNAIKLLADKWSAGATQSAAGDYSTPAMMAVGCDDLNDPAAITTTGVLFMEGESEPRELRIMKERLASLSAYFRRTGGWLAEKMEAGWEREAVLLCREYADIAYPRHVALINTTLTGQCYDTAGRIIGAAHQALASIELTPRALRDDRQGAAQVLRTAAWLMDEAAAALAKRAAENGLVDRAWTQTMAGLQQRIDDITAASPAGPETRPGPSASKSTRNNETK